MQKLINNKAVIIMVSRTACTANYSLANVDQSVQWESCTCWNYTLLNDKSLCFTVLMNLFLIWQVWQCPSTIASTQKRSQFELLAELEHDSGVSRETVWPTERGPDLFRWKIRLTLRRQRTGEHHRSESRRDSAGVGLQRRHRNHLGHRRQHDTAASPLSQRDCSPHGLQPGYVS